MTMVLEQGETIAGQEAAAKDDGGPAQIWNPPIKLWHLYVLIASTFGIYTLFWTYGISKDFRRHVGPRYKPLLIALLYWIPIVNLFFIYNQMKTINLLRARSDLPQRISAVTLVGLSALILGASVAVEYFTFDMDAPATAADSFVTLVQILTWPIPWLLMQRQYNEVKSSLRGVRWTRPDKFLPRHWFSTLIGLVFVALILLLPAYEPYLQQTGIPAGTPLKRGEQVSGAGADYWVRIPDESWSRYPAGSLATDADLEIAGRDQNAALVSYVACDLRLSLDEVVAGRRKEMASALSRLEVTEDRRIEVGRFLPISTARYTGVDSAGVRWTYWVTTLVDGEFVLEVIGSLIGERPDDVEAMEGLTGSFGISREGNECVSG